MLFLTFLFSILKFQIRKMVDSMISVNTCTHLTLHPSLTYGPFSLHMHTCVCTLFLLNCLRIGCGLHMASLLGNISSGQTLLQNCDMVEAEHGYSSATFSVVHVWVSPFASSSITSPSPGSFMVIPFSFDTGHSQGGAHLASHCPDSPPPPT